MLAEEVVSPAELGIDPTRLKYIDAHLQRYVDEGKFPGTLLLIARHGAIAHLSATGLADRERNVPVNDDTIFRIYSMSKPITSIALMQLFERGLLQLDDPVDRYIPEFSNLQVYVSGNDRDFVTRPADRKMTIRDLLSHQGGLSYGAFEGGTPVDAGYTRERVLGEGTLADMVQKLGRLPLQFSPGDRWHYSVSTDVCGYLVEVISGLRFDDYLSRNIFEPLGMVDTGFFVPAEKRGRFAANYAYAATGMRLIDDPAASTYANPPSLFSGGGGLVSTISDYFRFAQALCDGGVIDGVRIIGPKTLDLMTSNHLPDNKDLMNHALGRWSETAFSGIGFGLGFSITMDPAKAQVPGTPGEFSWGGAASTTFWVDPIEDLVVILMTQLMPSSTYNIRRELRSMVYGALTD